MIERIVIVGIVAALVVAAILVLRRRPVIRSRPVADTGLPPGVYLLSSDGCHTCRRARDTLTRREIAYTELSWEKNPEVFERMQIDAVPSVVQIDRGGAGTWWRGGVPRRLTRP